MSDLFEDLAELLKDYIHAPRTVKLTKHVVVKVKEVCNTRPTLTKTVLARVDDVISLQEIDWNGGHADVSVVPRIREETLFGDGENVRRPKV